MKRAREGSSAGDAAAHADKKRAMAASEDNHYDLIVIGCVACSVCGAGAAGGCGF